MGALRRSRYALQPSRPAVRPAPGHDAHAVVAGLCVDLVVEDPGTAVRARAEATLENPGDLHDPEAVSAAYLTAAAVFQL